MGRRKIEIKAIKDDRNRSVTFLKRKGGLFKKAHELSVLCSVDVAVIIFGHNKKLYQFSSGDIQEILDRHNYYGTPHEHKGPNDYTGRGGFGDDDDDDIDVSPPPDEHVVPEHPMQQHLHAAVGMPPHHHPLHRQGSHSVSPPLHQIHQVHQGHQKSNSMSNIPGYPPHPQNRLAAPQPSGLSRPASRNSHTRTASGHALVHPHTVPMAQQQGPQPQGQQPNGYYMPGYNQQQQPPQAQPPQMHVPQSVGPQGYPYQGPQGQGPAQQFLHQQETLQRRSSMPPAIPNQTHQPQQSPPLPQQPQQQQQPSQPQQQQQQQQQQQPLSHEQYVQQQHLAQPHEPPLQPPPPQEAQPPQEPQASQDPVYLDQPKRLSSKHRSIFTPISSDSSLLAQHWAMVNNPTPTSNSNADKENRSHSVDNGTVARANSNEKEEESNPNEGPASQETTKKKQRPNIPAISTDPTHVIPPPTRTGSMISTPGSGMKRPVLKVQIPSEHSDSGTPTAGSSPGTGTAGPQSGSKIESAHSVVLPPPSPSVNSATNVLSAGGTGPVNPFARPPPTSAVKGPPPDQTPLSALPSRFVAGDLLPSPSSFFGDWSGGFSAVGKDDNNMLPSPLNFRTPTTSRLYPDDDSASSKRKSPGSEASEPSAAKRVRA